jgi:hypothetical protein
MCPAPLYFMQEHAEVGGEMIRENILLDTVMVYATKGMQATGGMVLPRPVRRAGYRLMTSTRFMKQTQ